MRDVTNIDLPQSLIDLIPSRALLNEPGNGFYIAEPFIKAVLSYLQATRQNLPTGDFVKLICNHLVA